MELILTTALFLVLVLAAAMIRAWTVAEQAAREAEADAREHLDTARRIQDAIEDSLPPAAARDRLRNFAGTGTPSGER